MANFVKLNSIFSSLESSSFPYENEQYIISQYQDKGSFFVKILVNNENISIDEFNVFNLFLKALNIETILDNYGIATYNLSDSTFLGNCPAFFGIKTNTNPETGEITYIPGVQIGVTNEKFDSTSIFIECICEQIQVSRGKSTKLEWCYVLNDAELYLKENIDQAGMGTGKFYLYVKHSDENGDEWEFSFPYLLDKKIKIYEDKQNNNIVVVKENFENYDDLRDLTPQDINRLWKNGRFFELLRPFLSGSTSSGGSRLWATVNQMFQSIINADEFPKEGIYFLAHNPQMIITPSGTYEGISSDIISVEWEVIETSHPDLQIQIKNKEKIFENFDLRLVTNLKFSNAKKNNEGFNVVFQAVQQGNYEQFQQENGVIRKKVTPNMVCLIHIIRPNDTNKLHIPVNSCLRIYQVAKAKLEGLVSKFPNKRYMLETLEKYKNQMISKPSNLLRNPGAKQLKPAQSFAETCGLLQESYPIPASTVVRPTTTIIDSISSYEEDFIPPF